MTDTPRDVPPVDDDDIPIIVLPDDLDLDALQREDEREEEMREAAERAELDAISRRVTPQRIVDAFAIPEALVDETEQLRAKLKSERERDDLERVRQERELRAAELRRLRDIQDELDAEIADELAQQARLATLLRFVRAGGVVLVGLLAVLTWIGWPYYALPLASRPFHPFHDALRSSGSIGLTLGIGATVLMLASLAYLVRKRLVPWLGARTLTGWMRFHVAAGVLGPGLALVHASFVPTSFLGGLAIAAMAIVLGSGFAGRYLLMYVPKSADGGEVQIADLRRRLRVYRQKLIDLGVDASLIRVDDDDAPKSRRTPWLITAVVRVLLGDRESRRELRELTEAVQQQQGLGEEAGTVLVLVRRLCRERQWFVRHRELRRMVSAWRFAHRWLAIVMFAAIVFHVGLALRYANLFGMGDQ
ncbi:MAG: DUF4405 domain-containing protein [Planctomycetes bacterium]|nr:DUF4405 domain-containing protein [Planctomycetota bacterium]